MTRRRWIADTWTETTASLTGDQAMHLARVLRAQPGMECDVVVGGRVWHAAVVHASENEVRFNLLAELDAAPALPVTLLISVFKFDHMEWGIEKATELGVGRIVPMIARRTEKHLALAAPKRLERWRRIVREAAQQSRRSDIPEVADVVSLKLALQGVGAGPMVKMVLSELEQATTLKDAIERAAATVGAPPIAMAIGPEGGWAAEEVALFEAKSWIPVSLGPRILRAETAAISALSVLGALL